MPPHTSPTDERLRHTIAERMRMSPIDQPLMLMELLGRQRLDGFREQRGEEVACLSVEKPAASAIAPASAARSAVR